jgi:hypothetical protein
MPVTDRETLGGVTQSTDLRVNRLRVRDFRRRDVRVVEGARVDIALTVCDGVLRISITVADPES